MKTLAEMRAMMLGALALVGKSAITGEERMPHLPEGTYPCRIIFANGLVNIGTEEEPEYRLFNAWDGFSLNPEKNGIMLDLAVKATDKGFAEPTDQFAIMLEVIGGKYAEKHAHIPHRFNLNGYKRKSDFTEEEFLEAGYIEEEGYAIYVDPDGKHFRIFDEKKSAEAQKMLKGFIGAVFSGEKKEDGSDYDSVDLQLLCEAGEDLCVNVVMKKETKSAEGKEARIVPTFFNRFDIEKAEPKAEAVEESAPVAEEAQIPE
jgi:hypothetical protein